jgi:GNAT superfamily N-acetyltransferase
MLGDALAKAAANLAACHATSVEALGFRSTWWPGAWATDGAIPPLYLNAIVFGGLEPDEQERRLGAFFATSPPIILDGTNQLELGQLGLVRDDPKRCFWRVPDKAGEPRQPTELDIVEVRDAELLAEFEAASAEGFGAQSVPRFTWHAPGVLQDPRFRLWLGRTGAKAVGAAMAYVGDDVVGVYGVAVVPEARRHGYGAALTWRATQAEPRLPAALQPSDMAAGLYQRLGYVPVGHFTAWHRPIRSTT